MANALLGYTNRLLSGTLTAGSESPTGPVLNLRDPQGSTPYDWQTSPGAKTPSTGAYFIHDAGSPVNWRAFGLFRTNLTSGAQVRWRVGPAEGIQEETPFISLDATAPGFALPEGWVFNRNSPNANVSSYYDSSGSLAFAAINVPRVQHDLSTLNPLGILIEPARTNYVRNPRAEGAVAGTPGTLPTYWAVGLPSGLSRQVVGSGTESGVPYVDIRIFGTAAVTGSVIFWFEGNTNIAASASQQWVQSFYLSIAGGSLSNVQSLQHIQIERDSTGAYITQSGGATLAPTQTSLVRQRSEFLRTTSANANLTYIQPTLQFVVNNTATVDVTLRIGAPQMERGAFATMPMLPPVGFLVSSARSADSASYAIAGGLLNGATLYCEHVTTAIQQAVSSESGSVRLDDSTGGLSSAYLRVVAAGAFPYMDGRALDSSNAVVYDGPNIGLTLNKVIRQAFAVALDDFYTAHDGNDGGASAQDNTAAYPTINRVRVVSGERQWLLRAIKVYNKRLTNGQTKSLATNGSTLDPAALAFDTGLVPVGVVPGVNQAVTVAEADVTGRYCRCDIDDNANPDGFIRAALAYAGPAWQPSVNVSSQSTFSWDVNEETPVTRGGQEFPRLNWEQRRWDIVFNAIKSAEFWPSYMEFLRLARQNYNVLYVPDPADADIQRETVFGRAKAADDVTFPTNSKAFRAARFRITERL